MITAQSLTRRFGSFTAVQDVSFHLERGEVVGFLGLNGAGKTTTMRMLAGFLPPTDGSVTICGFDVLRQSLEVRRRIGYLPEAVPLYREHRVGEMLRFQARLHGMGRADARRRIDVVLERVGLADRTRTIIGRLSKGLRQRVGIAVALLPDPEVLILDEPTSGLDPLQRLEVRKLVQELAADRTVLLSSHILPEVEAVCPRVIVIHRGRIVADGTQEQLVGQLGGASLVRLEALVGPGEGSVAEALRLLGQIRGVTRVEGQGRLGIHHVFAVHCEEDLREDVGALAAAKGWALRELSWHRPTLESLFSKVALDLGGDEGSAQGVPVPAPVGVPGSGSVPVPDAGGLAVLSPRPARKESVPKQVYNLNPFDQGASRDLGKPKAIDEEAES